MTARHPAELKSVRFTTRGIRGTPWPRSRARRSRNSCESRRGHATDDRLREIADNLSAMAKAELKGKKAIGHATGTEAEEEIVTDASPGRNLDSDLGFVVGGA